MSGYFIALYVIRIWHYPADLNGPEMLWKSRPAQHLPKNWLIVFCIVCWDPLSFILVLEAVRATLLLQSSSELWVFALKGGGINEARTGNKAIGKCSPEFLTFHVVGASPSL